MIQEMQPVPRKTEVSAEKLTTDAIKERVEIALQNRFGNGLPDTTPAIRYPNQAAHLSVRIVPSEVFKREHAIDAIKSLKGKLSTDENKVDKNIAKLLREMNLSGKYEDSIIPNELRRGLLKEGVNSKIRTGSSGHTFLTTNSTDGIVIIEPRMVEFYPQRPETFVGTEDDLQKLIFKLGKSTQTYMENGRIKKSNIESTPEKLLQDNWGIPPRPLK